MHFYYIYFVVYFLLHVRNVISFSLERESIVERRRNSDLTSQKEVNVMSMDEINTATDNITKIRAKRQSGGAGKFTDAAKMPQVKIMRLFTQLFKNFWDSAYVGGSHPLHPNIPKTIAALYRQKIVEFFVPNVGQDLTKPMS